jgi:UDPglucose 6-dehydrogenase
MATLGHDVVGFDTDKAKIAALAAGEAPFYEPGLPELLADALATGRLRFTSDVADVHGCEVHFICVGTPQLTGEIAADLSYVDASVASLLPHLSAGDLVVGKSTVPVGTAERLTTVLDRAETGAVLTWNPEFLREGHAVRDTLHPDRLVYGVPAGVEGDRSVKQLDEVYAATLADGTPRLVTDLATAQLVKVAANSFLATKISFIRRLPSRRRHRARRPHRPQVPQLRARLRRRLPPQGHPGVHGPGRRAGRRPDARVPARGRRHQQPPTHPHGGDRP